MPRVLLVCSVHREQGTATVGALHWLLTRLRPDVIFVEWPSSSLPMFLDGSAGTLESAAVSQYRRSHLTDVIPVDIEPPHPGVKKQFDEMFDRIAQASPSFCAWDVAHRQETAEGGFAYLNSELASRVEREIRREVQAAVDLSADPAFATVYSRWTQANEARELAMLDRIRAHAAKAPFCNGVLIVGAAHRQSLLEKTQASADSHVPPLELDLGWQEELDRPDVAGSAWHDDAAR